MRFYQISTTVLLVATVAACSGGQSGEWAGSVTDSAGVAMVSNPTDGAWEAGEAWAVEEELRIGSLEGDPSYQFGQVAPGGITVDSDGRIYVLDAQAQEIKVYTPEGVYESTIAQRGSGPGELTGAGFLVMGPGDTLVVPDVNNRRVNLFLTDGTSLGSFPVALEDGLPMVFQSTKSGTIAYQVRPLDLPNMPTTDSMDAILELSLDGTVADTLLRFPSGRTFSFSGGAPEFNIYAPEPTWDLGGDGHLLFAINDDYRIEVRDSDGVLRRVITKPFEQKPVTDADKDAVMDFFEEAWADAGVPPNVVEQLRNAVHFGSTFPAFANLIAGPDGSVWVQHIQPASELSEEELETYNLLEDSGAPRWDVFDSDGRFLGVVETPPRFTPRLFRDDMIYGVWRDELDVQYVMRLKVVRAT